MQVYACLLRLTFHLLEMASVQELLTEQEAWYRLEWALSRLLWNLLWHSEVQRMVTMVEDVTLGVELFVLEMTVPTTAQDGIIVDMLLVELLDNDDQGAMEEEEDGDSGEAVEVVEPVTTVLSSEEKTRFRLFSAHQATLRS
eukprot:s248_g15.t1